MTREEFIAKYSGGHYGDSKSLENKVAVLTGLLFENSGENQLTVTADTTLTEDDMGRTINVGTDAKVVTLPLITSAILGKPITFRNIGADGGVALTISPNASDGINGSVPASAGANADATTADGLVSKASGTVNKDLVNTKATANGGDWVTLVAVAATKWYITGGVGIWASES